MPTPEERDNMRAPESFLTAEQEAKLIENRKKLESTLSKTETCRPPLKGMQPPGGPLANALFDNIEGLTWGQAVKIEGFLPTTQKARELGTIEPAYGNETPSEAVEKLAFVRGAISKYGDVNDPLISYLIRITLKLSPKPLLSDKEAG